MRILFVCERSAGHIFPALSMAQSIGKNNEIYFFVTAPKLKRYIEQEGYEVLGRCFSKRNAFIELIYRIPEAFFIIFKIRPTHVVGLGGRDSLFLVLFSRLFLLNVVIYEANVRLGKANKILSLLVPKVLRGFPEDKHDKKSEFVGVPLRQNILRIDKFNARRRLNLKDLPTILFLGGSQGCSFINRICKKFAINTASKIQIIHITGQREYFSIRSFYNKIEGSIFVCDFYLSAEVLYSAADVVVCRSGASTLAEVTFFRIPAVLIPFSGARSHQKENALFFVKRGAALMFEEGNFSFKELGRSIEGLLFDRARRDVLAGNLSRIKLGFSPQEFMLREHLGPR
ncbi:MAG: UDP-N-acetylglucosamine--N-acetylmuramyl-(pentapeptide) pyrophosphoryl-undecaprenol N-acetylglucosamine transferase [Candidatus Omnitrophota bacterium]